MQVCDWCRQPGKLEHLRCGLTYPERVPQMDQVVGPVGCPSADPDVPAMKTIPAIVDTYHKMFDAEACEECRQQVIQALAHPERLVRRKSNVR